MTLAACGSAMLLAATNVLCQQVAVIPFLWVVPLVVYLLSFSCGRIGAADGSQNGLCPGTHVPVFSYAWCGSAAVVLAGCAVALRYYATRQRVAWSRGEFITRLGAVLALLILGGTSWVGVHVSLGNVVALQKFLRGALSIALAIADWRLSDAARPHGRPWNAVSQSAVRA